MSSVICPETEESKEQLRQWVSDQLGVPKIGGDMFAALGISNENKLIGGVIYHEYRGHMIEMSLATISTKWCTKKTLKALFSYPFNIAKVSRLNVTCSKGNKKMRSILNRLGFKQEGCARKAFDGRQDAIIYGMLEKECKWN